MELLNDKTKLVMKKGHALEVGTAASLLSRMHMVGFYFSADWCMPGRKSTERLAKAFQKAKDDGILFQVIYVSLDETDDDMRQEFKDVHGDWLSIPFNDTLRIKLVEAFHVEEIPALIIVKQENGEIITTEGIRDIQITNEEAPKMWNRMRVLMEDIEP